MRSKQKEYMDELQSNVLTVTKGLDKEDRKFALDYLRKHVKIDDLHRTALKDFPQKTIVFGQGSYSAKLMVITKDPIKPEQKARLEKAWDKLNIPQYEVYYAHLRFVATKKKQDTRQEILDRLIEIISPSVVLSFDDLELDIKDNWVNFTHSISILTSDDTKEEKKMLTQQLKEVRRLIYK